MGAVALYATNESLDICERYDDAVLFAPRGRGRGAGSGNPFAVYQVPSRARETATNFLLIGWMQFLAVADIDRHGQRGQRIIGRRPALRLAQAGPIGSQRRGRRRTEVRQLDDEKRQVRC